MGAVAVKNRCSSSLVIQGEFEKLLLNYFILNFNPCIAGICPSTWREIFYFVLSCNAAHIICSLFHFI